MAAKKRLEFDEKRYLKSRGVRCPWCRDTDITGEGVEVDGGHASQEVSCANCGGVWVDVYTLTGVEISEEPDANEGSEDPGENS